MDFDHYLRTIGLRTQVSWSPAVGSDGKPEPDLRVSAFNAAGDSTLRIRITDPTSAWGRAGLHTSDRLVSLDGHPAATTDFRTCLGNLHIGDTARVEVMRDGAVSRVAVIVTGYNSPTVRIIEIADATSDQNGLRAQWLAAGQ